MCYHITRVNKCTEILLEIPKNVCIKTLLSFSGSECLTELAYITTYYFSHYSFSMFALTVTNYVIITYEIKLLLLLKIFSTVHFRMFPCFSRWCLCWCRHHGVATVPSTKSGISYVQFTPLHIVFRLSSYFDLENACGI